MLLALLLFLFPFITIVNYFFVVVYSCEMAKFLFAKFFSSFFFSFSYLIPFLKMKIISLFFVAKNSDKSLLTKH